MRARTAVCVELRLVAMFQRMTTTVMSSTDEYNAIPTNKVTCDGDGATEFRHSGGLVELGVNKGDANGRISAVIFAPGTREEYLIE